MPGGKCNCYFKSNAVVILLSCAHFVNIAMATVPIRRGSLEVRCVRAHCRRIGVLREQRAIVPLTNKNLVNLRAHYQDMTMWKIIIVYINLFFLEIRQFLYWFIIRLELLASRGNTCRYLNRSIRLRMPFTFSSREVFVPTSQQVCKCNIGPSLICSS